MRRTPRTLAAALATVLATSVLALTNTPANAGPTGPEQRVIVTLSGDAALDGATDDARGRGSDIADARRAVRDRQDDFVRGAREAGVRGTDVANYDLLVNAVAMTVPADQVDGLAALPGVAAVHYDVPVTAHTDFSVPLVGAPELWATTDADGQSATGTGVTVAVIDTGVDYTHPDLGGCLGDGCKVVGGYDFVDDDDNPMDDHGHGTHVAGIVGADAASDGGITGVAPGVSITAYKVLDASGSGTTEDIVAALERATDPDNPHRADVINMSLGAPTDGTDPLSMAAATAVEAGVVVVTSAGNDGPGSGTVTAPGLVDSVITVGASTSNLILPVAHLAGPEPTLLQTWRGAISANAPAEPVTAELVDVGFGSDFDFDAAGDVTGKIVRINAFITQDPTQVFPFDLELAQRAEDRGAIAMIGGQSFGFPGPGIGLGVGSVDAESGVANVAPSHDVTAEGLRMSSLVVMGMSGDQYNALSPLLAAGPVEITLSGEDATDQIASFSSRGPTADLRIKPDLVAPGVEIVSTVPTALEPSGEFAISGTSMASPHVAGAAALLLQLDPEQTPAEAKSKLVGSAVPLTGTAPTVHGSGRLDAGDPDDPGVWWLGNAAGLWRTEDGGQSVTKVLDGAVTSILFTADEMILGGRDIRISTDGGEKFKQHELSGGSVLVSDLVEVGGVLYAGTMAHFVDGFSKGARGVLTSSDGRTWTSVAGGMKSLEINGLAASPDGAWLYAATDNGVQRMSLDWATVDLPPDS